MLIVAIDAEEMPTDAFIFLFPPDVTRSGPSGRSSRFTNLKNGIVKLVPPHLWCEIRGKTRFPQYLWDPISEQ